jgi:gliding motility-associated-like protein
MEAGNEIPKFFSPNGDGIGDVWVIRNIQAYETCELTVFSRSGQKVLQKRPYQNDWDGTFNGKPLMNGDYYYIFTCDDGRVIKGALQVIR